MASGSYRTFVGPEQHYDVMAAIQFNLMTFLGLREGSFLLDVGCGSLRGGRLFIPYLLPGHYFGIEPEKWLVEEGVKNEIGRDLLEMRKPTFSNDINFTLTTFGRKFDFLLAQSIFSHAPASQVKRCLSEAEKVMHEESIFAATFCEGEKDYDGEKWFAPGIIPYRFDTLARFCEEVGLSCRRMEWAHPNNQKWVVVTRKESKATVQTVPDLQLLKQTQMELDRYKRRVAALESHLVIRWGRKVKRLFGS